jgi:predicted dehydrogenase
MKSKLNWGILSTGNIAAKFAQGVLDSKTGQLTAVASRSLASAKKFAGQYKVPQAYGSYSEILKDPQIEAVYIGTPHPFHAQWAIAAAKAGKHILCEKPLAMNSAEAKKIIRAAKRHKVFLMEAFMYRCHPQTDKVAELIRKGVIGKVRHIQGSFCLNRPYDPKGRLFNPELGGGAILDIGCYPASFSRLVAGAAQGKAFIEPVKVEGRGRIGLSGVDEWSSATLKFKGGITAELLCSVRFAEETRARVLGSKGSIFMTTPWRPADSGVFIQKSQEKQPKEIRIKIDRGIYAWEADTVAHCIRSGKLESTAMSWNDTLGNMKLLDSWFRAVKKSAVKK